ncbi:MAG TPA: hypothetical protein VGK92_15670 [Gaiellales bacterium]
MSDADALAWSQPPPDARTASRLLTRNLDLLACAIAAAALIVALTVCSPVSPTCSDYGDTAYVSPWFSFLSHVSGLGFLLAGALAFVKRAHLAAKIGLVLAVAVVGLGGQILLWAATVPCGFH